jgi:hypothetical protein
MVGSVGVVAREGWHSIWIVCGGVEVGSGVGGGVVGVAKSCSAGVVDGDRM